MSTNLTEPQRTVSSRRKLRKAQGRLRSLLGVQVVGTGSYVPDQVVTNEDLSVTHGFDPDWIVQRTGIRQRRYAAPGEATSDLCVEAARRAMQAADVRPADIDLVLVATFTPDMAFPATACLVQAALGLNAPAMDLQAACAGFMYALVTGAQYVATGCSKLALVIGGDCNSRILNPRDQRTFPLFGDGAGAVVLAKGHDDQGLVGYQLGSDGSGGDLLNRPAGGSRLPVTCDLIGQDMHYLQMDGRAVFKWAVRILTESILDVMDHSSRRVEDISLLVAHQANFRILKAATDVLAVPSPRIFNNLDRYGNTSAGSIPIALDEAFREGRFDENDLLLVSGFGAGLTWGTALLKW
jgi:3-oxoacyl-[acyl-carrier-protein] synthase-3